MPTREQVKALVEQDLDYEEARRLKIHPGLAYLIATGAPVGSGYSPGRQNSSAPAPASSQHLANPPHIAPPEANERVRDWIKQQVSSDLQTQAAGKG